MPGVALSSLELPEMHTQLDYTVVFRIHRAAHWIGLALAFCGVAYCIPYMGAFFSRSNLGLMEIVYGSWFLIALAFVFYSIPRFVGALVAIFFTPRAPD